MLPLVFVTTISISIENQDPLDNTSNYEIINYVNDVSLKNPQVLMTSDKNENYTEAYTYGLDRISSDNLTADGKDNPFYYLYDGRGSVGQVINSSGDVKKSYSYDPFGVTDHDGPLGNSKAHYQDYFGFNGEEYNNISCMQYLRARYYEADTGRFLTRDSYMGNIMNPLSLNRYDYALNNPVMNIDPSGNKALAISDDGVAAANSYGMLRNGSSGKDVALLQTMLSAAGFNPGTIDGIFGNNTEKAVRAYQASKGLSVDGIVGNQTWGALGGKVTASSTASNSTALPTLRKGSTDTDAIKKLQQALIAQHYDLGPSGDDGIFGNKTEQAVLNFQWSKNLSVDGIVGSQTWGALLGQSKACDGKDYIGSQGTGNPILTQDMKKSGVTITTIDGIQYFDYSQPINKMLIKNEKESLKHVNDLDGGLIWFKNQVDNNAPWDIKREKQWVEQIGVPYPGFDKNGDFEKFVYNGEVMTAETLGNITYGYWGTSLNYGPELLFLGGGVAAVGMKKALHEGPPYYGDQKQDHVNIQKGIDLYNKTHP